MEKLAENNMPSLITVKADTIESIKLLCERATLCPCRVWGESGTCKVNAASLFGLFSLDTSKPFTLEVENGDYASLFSSWAV